MAYQKQTWYDLPNQTTPVNAERLNHIEDGIEEAFENGGSGVPVGTEVEYDGNTVPEGWEQVDEKAEILWTNPSPTSSFSQRIITIPTLPDYDEFEIFFYDNTTRRAVSSTKLLKNQGTNMMAIFQLNDHGNIGNRNINWSTDTKLQVNDAVTIIVNDAFSRTANNAWCIPIYIVGYKTGLFS